MLSGQLSVSPKILPECVFTLSRPEQVKSCEEGEIQASRKIRVVSIPPSDKNKSPFI
jgi:hypothetical protein